MGAFIVCAILWFGLLPANCSGGTAAVPPTGTGAAGIVEKVARIANAVERLEFTQMYSAIVNGSDLGPGVGWFKKPGLSRYGWNWLADRFDAKRTDRITREQFTGPRELFDRLDRNGDGVITKDDLDGSEGSPHLRQLCQAGLNVDGARRDGNWKVSMSVWNALFLNLTRRNDATSVEDRRGQVHPPELQRKPGTPSGMPSKATLLKALFAGELGSPTEGPGVGEQAPDFTLTTQDGKKTITLSKYWGHKPVVLIFGSFT